MEEIYIPTTAGRKAGAPFIIKRSDGKLVVSFQTDEDTAGTGDDRSVFKTVQGNSDATGWGSKVTVWPCTDGTNSDWNSLMVVDNTTFVAATSSTYPSPGIYLRWSSTVTPLGRNLTTNGSFETANVSGWTTYGTDYPNRIIVHGINDGIARWVGGGNSFIGLAAPGTGTGTAYLGQTLYGLDNGLYTLKAFLRSGGGQPLLYMEAKDYGGTARTVNFPVTANWTQTLMTGVNVTNNQATIGFYAQISSASQWADLDSVEFVKESGTDFNNGSDSGWTRYGGSWTLTGGGYDLAGGASGKSITGDPSWKNVVVEADVKPIDAPNAGIVFRVTNPGTGADQMNGYFAGLSSTSVVLGKMNGSWTTLASIPMTINTNQNYHLRVAANSSLIQVFVDDMAIPKLSVTDSSYAFGATGLRAHFSHTFFDNFVVR